MNLRLSLVLAAAFGLFALPAARADGTPAAASDIAVTLTPDVTAPALAHLKSDDARLATAKPAADPVKAALGWQTLDLPGPFTGYVPTDKSRKDLSVIPGTPVHLLADDKSPVLGNAPDSPALILTSADVLWSQVSFPGPITGYYLKAAASTPATTPAAMVVTPTPTPPPTVVTPTKTVSAATPPLTAVNPTPTAKPAAAMAKPASTANTPDPTDIPQYYFGTLKQRTDLTISGPVNAKYLLYGTKGELIALVDLNDVVLSTSVANFINRSVRIYGTAYPGHTVPYVTIHAITLQAF
ncbi:MAG TPA: hypothetical protein VK737_05760 [Opitutales bacterium]|jgi:hypothetical protein|nr:hypothetical protein [Opitutales bacterium]